MIYIAPISRVESEAVCGKGRGGLVVGRPTAVREDPGSNLIAAGRVYHDSHCDIQPWARVVHPYCSA